MQCCGCATCGRGWKTRAPCQRPVISGGNQHACKDQPLVTKMKTSNNGSFFLFVCVMVVIGVFGTYWENSPQKRRRDEESRRQFMRNDSIRRAEEAVAIQEARVASSIEQARVEVLMQLRDPESARFGRMWVANSDEGQTVCGSVNARNGFGGYSGSTEFYVRGEGNVMIRSGSNREYFDKRFAALCSLAYGSRRSSPQIFMDSLAASSKSQSTQRP